MREGRRGRREKGGEREGWGERRVGREGGAGERGVGREESRVGGKGTSSQQNMEVHVHVVPSSEKMSTTISYQAV